MSFETIQIDSKDQITTITINRPKALNALNEQVLTELAKAFREIRRDETVRGVIITGSGDKAFVAGADITAMQNMTPIQAIRFGELGHRTMRAIETCHAPVVAAVNGFALGGGLELALACDFIYASSNAKLGLPEVNLGIFPGFGGTQRLSRLIGRNKAKELIFTANMLTADQAKEWGIVNTVTSFEELKTSVEKTLNLIASKGPVAISLAKKVINEGSDLALSSGLTLEENTFPLTFSTEDKKEGVSAFIEKRKPSFKGI